MSDFITPIGRASFPHLFEPNDKNKYEINILLDKSDPENAKWVAALKTAIKAKIAERWPNEAKRPNVKALNIAIADGDSEHTSGKHNGKKRAEVRPEVAGNWIVTARTGRKPAVVDERVQTMTDASAFYSGCRARCSFNIFAYENETVGVGFGLQNVQKTGDDDSFGSSSRAEDDFSAIDSDLGDLDTATSAAAGVSGVADDFLL
jgi:hypothetical protein